MAELVVFLVVACIVSAVSAQDTTTPSSTPTPYATLPPPPTYRDGAFLTPNTSLNQIFNEGAHINVTWETTYEAVNLYFGVRGGGISVSIGQTATWIDYVIQCRNNDCSKPYSFRAVNSYGTEEDLTHGGFYTGLFWIEPAESQATVSTSTTSSTTSSTTDASLSTSDMSSTPSSENATKTPESSATPSASAGSSTNSTAIGTGVGVGVGIVLLTLCGVGFWWIRRKRSKRLSSAEQVVVDEPEVNGDVKSQRSFGDKRLGMSGLMPAETVQNRKGAVHEAPTAVDPVELSDTAYELPSPSNRYMD